MKRYSITLSYNGAGLSGWQIQNNGTTVQELVQNALSTLLREDIKVTGAGRTDSGVNAINYVAHFDCSDAVSSDAGALSYKINAILPESIKVHEIREVSSDFHARFSATLREYKYFLHLRKDPFAGKFSFFCRYDLDVEKMNQAAGYLLGTHDFSCFEKTGGGNATSVCTVYEAGWKVYTPVHVGLLGFPAEEGDYLVFTVSANRFLRNMVRAVVGTLIDVGRGRRSAESVRSLVEGGSRCDAGESVPGHALFLSKVSYR